MHAHTVIATSGDALDIEVFFGNSVPSSAQDFRRLARSPASRLHRQMDPSGQTHTTRPGSYALFPKLCEPKSERNASPKSAATTKPTTPNGDSATWLIAVRDRPPPF
jgi:hypothetical protein